METLGVPNDNGACGTLSTSRWREQGDNGGYDTAEGTRGENATEVQQQALLMHDEQAS